MTKQTISIEMLVSPSARAMNRTSPLGLSGAGYATAVDFLGNSYVVGSASVTGQLGSRAGRDVFLAKVTPTGQVESVTYFGGSGDEEGPFAVVADGFRVLVAGTTRSDDFPMVRKGNVLAGGSDIFVATFSLQGEMTKARIFGGSGDEKLTGFSYDGDLHLVGSTTSSDFPVTPGAFQTKLGGDRDGFYARVSGADQSSLMYATYVGGSTDDVAESVASNKFSSLEGRPYVYIAGKTLSQDFPHTTGDSSRVGGAFVVKLCPDVACAEKPIARVFPGCAASGQGGAITAAGADYSGNVYVVTSAAAGLAVKDSSIQNRNMGGTDLYLVELSRDLDEIKRATYFGGDGDDVPSGVQVDFEGNIFVAGRTVSERFPGTRPPRGIWRGATQHLFVCWFAPDLAKVWFSRFIAVDPTDGSATLPISLDGQRNIYLAGRMNVSSRSPGAPMLEKLSMIADGVSLRVSNPDDGTWPSISSVKESKPGWLSIRGRSFSKRPHIFLGDTIPLSMNVIDDGNVEVELGSKKRDFVISLTSERGHGALAAYPYVPIAVSPQREGAWASALVPPPQVPLHLDRVSFGARQVSVAAMIIVLALLIAGRRTE